MRRHALGIVALLFLIGWAGLLAFAPETSANQLVAGSAMRIGLVLGALWLALPQLIQIKAKVPGWLLGSLAAAGLIIAVRPSLAVYVLVVLVVFGVIQATGRFLSN